MEDSGHLKAIRMEIDENGKKRYTRFAGVNQP